MTQLKVLIRSVLIGVFLSIAAMAQDSSGAKTTCDSSPDAVQIRFGHVETLAVVKGKPTNIYWLKLLNNSSCAIEIEVPLEFLNRTFPIPRIARDQNGQFIKNANGGFQIERFPKVEFKNGDKVKVIYNLTNSQLKSIGAGNIEGCNVNSITMLPGQEFLFPVDSPVFKKNHSVEVMFGYLGERPFPNQPLLHHKTVFAFNDIPQELIQSIK